MINIFLSLKLVINKTFCHRIYYIIIRENGSQIINETVQKNKSNDLCKSLCTE